MEYGWSINAMLIVTVTPYPPVIFLNHGLSWTFKRKTYHGTVHGKHSQNISSTPIRKGPKHVVSTHIQPGWWFGTFFYSSIQLGMSSSQLTNSYFSDG